MITQEQGADHPLSPELTLSLLESSAQKIAQESQLSVNEGALAEQHPLLVSYSHARRVATVANDLRIPPSVRSAITEEYVKFRRSMETGHGESQVKAWNEYRAFVRPLEAEYGDVLGNKCKYYTSILEEVLILISRTHVEKEIERFGLQGLPFGLGEFDCAIRVTSTQRGRLISDTKQVDYGLVLRLEGRSEYIPLVGFEVKKYIDKTMYTTVLNTVSALRSFRPKGFFGLVAEDENRGPDVVAQSELWDREFVLTGQRREGSELNPIVVENFERFRDLLLQKLTAALAFVAAEVASDAEKEANLSVLKRKARHAQLSDALLDQIDDFKTEFAEKLDLGLEQVVSLATQMGRRGKKPLLNPALGSAFARFRTELLGQLALGLEALESSVSRKRVRPSGTDEDECEGAVAALI